MGQEEPSNPSDATIVEGQQGASQQKSRQYNVGGVVHVDSSVDEIAGAYLLPSDWPKAVSRHLMEEVDNAFPSRVLLTTYKRIANFIAHLPSTELEKLVIAARDQAKSSPEYKFVLNIVLGNVAASAYTAAHEAAHLQHLKESASVDRDATQNRDDLSTSLLSDYKDAYARLEQKYIQLLAGLMSAQFPVPGGLPYVFSDVSIPSTSGDKIIKREEPGSLLKSPLSFGSESTMVRIEVEEEPLTVEQMGILFSTLSTLTTKYWLISQGRFADLIEFSRSHDERFIREAQVVITRISYNSPLNFDIKMSATDVAQGITTTIDGIVQTGQRLKQMDLATKTKELELQQAEQRFAEELQRARQQEAFEQEKRQLELARQQLELERLRLGVEQQRLGLLEARLEAQRKSMDHAFEIAQKVIGQLHPQADDATKRMLIQTYVSDILQLLGISFKNVTVIEVDQTPPVGEEGLDADSVI